MSTLPHPPRAIGVFRRDDLPRGTRETCLALWQLADPGNVGTLIRSADAFGAAVSLSEGCADPLSQKALRASAGAIFRVPLVPWDERPGRQVALAATGAVALADVDLTPPVTIVLGAERAGLPDELLEACDAVAAIPMPGDAESLNVAAAGAIALYELSRRASVSVASRLVALDHAHASTLHAWSRCGAQSLRSCPSSSSRLLRSSSSSSMTIEMR